MRILLLGVIALLFASSCTENQKAKNYGGTAHLTLPPNEKLINVTWKDNDLWYVTRPMVAGDTATVYNFREESDYGVWEGQYIITEVKQ
jgi:hypothetical protein